MRVRRAMPGTIRLDVADGIATLTLDQPEKRNPMSARMGEEIAKALAGLEPREDVRVLVLAGRGRRSARVATWRSSVVLRMLKRAVYQGLEGVLAPALEYEAFCQAVTYTTADLREGIAAARERRQPRFTGR